MLVEALLRVKRDEKILLCGLEERDEKMQKARERGAKYKKKRKKEFIKHLKTNSC